MSSREQVVRDSYRAFQSADRELIERCLADQLMFSSPPDPVLDRDGYFARCWPGANTVVKSFEIERMIDSGKEIVVTYNATRADGSRFRNTEIFTLDAEDRITRIEVYFGWAV